MNWLAQYYVKSKEVDYGYNSLYLGIIEMNENGQYISTYKSKVVEDYFNSIINERIEKSKKAYEEHKKREDENDFAKSLKIKINLLKNKRMIRDRADNPYFKLVNRYKKQTDGKEICDYDGINISEGENRGYILRLRDIDRIGKDGSGTYLYSGFIENASDESNVEFYDNRNSTPVCFELYGSLNDIINSGNPKEINALLKFFSNPKNFSDNKELKYIGGLDKIDGQFVEFRGEEPISPAITMQVKKMKEEYANDKKKEEGQTH